METPLNGNLAKYGLVGVCLALISLISFMCYKSYEREERITALMENHFVHNTAIMEQLKASTENNTKATIENTQVLRDLKSYLIERD